VVIKIGIVGNPKIGRTSLMRSFVDSEFEAYYNQTFGVYFKEKTIKLQEYKIRFSIWDYGHPEFIPLVCYDSVAILIMFDLSQISMLKKFEKETKYNITKMAHQYASKMNASLIFSLSKYFINVEKIFKVILSKYYNLRCNISEIKKTGYPILEYKNNLKTDVISFRKLKVISLTKKLFRMKVIDKQSFRKLKVISLTRNSFPKSKILSLTLRFFDFDFWTYTKSILRRLKII
ncbi:43200_t:CDS:2, partial [Gigaspora margarita]